MRKILLCSASGLCLGWAAPALAQDAADTAGTEDLIIVTGSRIPQPSNLNSSSPITALSSDEFALRGTSKVEDIVNTLPQAFAAQGSSISNGATGTATLNLRNLGTTRNLVLIDGRRMPYGSAPFTVAADVNQIPSALVDRVEVVTGGASAVYGSDAISGVVNFIMKRDFEGLRLDGQFSFYQHDNTDEVAQGLLDDAGYDKPDSSVLDGFGKDFSVLLGANSGDGKGNVTAYFTYHHNDEVLQRDRDFSACAYGSAGAEFQCVGSSNIAEGRFTDFGFNDGDPDPDPLRDAYDLMLDPVTGDFVPRAGRTYNYGPFNHFLRPDERFLFGTLAHYELNKYAEVYMDLMYHDDRTIAQIAPSGSFFLISALNCGNPLMSSQQATAIGCTASDITNNNSVIAFVGKRNVEGGNRQNDLRHTTFRGVFGVKGETGLEGFTYDVFGMWANVHFANNFLNDTSVTRMGRALNVVDDGMGNAVCSSTLLDPSDPAYDGACVPWDLFSVGGVTQAALDYISVPGFADANTTQQMVSGAVTGDLGVHGFKSPMATNGVRVALGGEYRRDTLEFRSDIEFCDRGFPAASDLAGQGGPICPTEGFTYVYEGFVETRIPLIEDKQFIQSLEAELGYRYSEYNLAGSTHTWKLLGNWSPTEDIRFRGGWQRAVRAPNVTELFLPAGIALFDLNQGPNDLFDPCASGVDDDGNPIAPARSQADCERTGVPGGAYGSVPDNPAGQFNSLLAGNRALEGEKANTYTAGAVITPRAVPNLVLSIDYFDIRVDGFINSLNPGTTLIQCLDTGDPFFCDKIHRDPLTGYSLWVSPAGFIDAQIINTGSLSTKGVDFQVNYGFDFERVGAAEAGAMNFDFIGTWLDSFGVQELPGFDVEECVGTRGSSGTACGSRSPTTQEWRHKFRATWQSPWKFDFSVAWRYFSAVDNTDSNAAEVNQHWDAEQYLDFAVRFSPNDNMSLRMGVNNVLDNDPPLASDVGAGFGNGNTNPQVYDAIGRYFFFSATVDF